MEGPRQEIGSRSTGPRPCDTGAVVRSIGHGHLQGHRCRQRRTTGVTHAPSETLVGVLGVGFYTCGTHQRKGPTPVYP